MFETYPYRYNPYYSQLSSYSNQQPLIQGVKFVQDIQEVQNIFTPYGAKVLFMNQNEDVFYLKETDNNGLSNITSYRFEEIKPVENQEYITREEFERWKEDYEQFAFQSQRQSIVAQQPQKSNGANNAVRANDKPKSSKRTSKPANTAEQNVFSRV